MSSTFGRGCRSEKTGKDARSAQHAAAAFGFLRHTDSAAQTGPQRAAQHGALVGRKTASGLHAADKADGDVFHALSFSPLIGSQFMRLTC